MKQLNTYIVEKLKIDKESSLTLIEKIKFLCAFKDDEKAALAVIKKWIEDNKVKDVDILCWHQTLDNFKLPQDNSKYIIDNTDLYSYYIHAWHDYPVFMFKPKDKNSFSVSYRKGDNDYLVIGYEEADNGFKSFIIVDHKKLIDENEIPE